MAEKNTLSILENIKKKMQKFEQKPTKTELVDDATGEFQNIASKKPLDVATSTATETNSTTSSETKVEANIMLGDDLGMDNLEQAVQVSQKPISDIASSVAPAHNVPIAPVVNNTNDDLDFSDLDVDDEVVATTNPAPAAPASSDVDNLDDLDLDALLKEEDEKRFKEQNPTATVPVAIIEENQQNISTPNPIEESKLTIPATEPAATKNYDDLNDIDLDNLFAEDGKQEEIKPIEPIAEVIKPAEPIVEIAPLEPLAEVKPIEPALETKLEEIILPELTPEPKANDLNLESLNLESLESPEEIKELEPKLEEIKAEVAEDIFSPVNSEESLPKLEELNLSKEDPEKEIINDEPALLAEDLHEKINTENSSQNNVSVMPSTETRKEYNSDSMAIIHQETIHQTNQSIKKLMDATNTIGSVKNLAQNSGVLNELAMQLMEPKLEKWLNENLAELVERIVQEEIKKIIPKE